MEHTGIGIAEWSDPNQVRIVLRVALMPDLVHLTSPGGFPTPPPMIVLAVDALPPGAFPLQGHPSESLQLAIDKDTARVLRDALVVLTQED
jgi:hypothetical protein